MIQHGVGQGGVVVHECDCAHCEAVGVLGGLLLQQQALHLRQVRLQEAHQHGTVCRRRDQPRVRLGQELRHGL